eukprot:767528-Hanusia_phi.AAC.3
MRTYLDHGTCSASRDKRRLLEAKALSASRDKRRLLEAKALRWAKRDRESEGDSLARHGDGWDAQERYLIAQSLRWASSALMLSLITENPLWPNLQEFSGVQP